MSDFIEILCITLFFIQIMALVALLSILSRPRLDPPTHAGCVTYFVTRTSGWTNPPSIDRIHTDAVYCGNVS
jgi:hypothetical protein